MIRSTCREQRRRNLRQQRPREQGFALAIAIIVAVLYFAMIELLMLDASRELAQARQFRARVVAQTLAENGAELAALQFVPSHTPTANVTAEDFQGVITGTMRKTSAGSGATQQLFTLTGTGNATGLVKARATVQLTGRIVGNRVVIDYASHSR